MTVEQAAYGAHLIAASNMIRAIKAVSSERGRDPREYALVAFGGNGPLFAVRYGAGAEDPPGADPARRPACSHRSGCSTPMSRTTSPGRARRCSRRSTPAEIDVDPAPSWRWTARARLSEDGFAAARIETQPQRHAALSGPVVRT